MRLPSLFSTLTPSFLSPKKSKKEDAHLQRSDNQNAVPRQARGPSQQDPVAGAEEAIARGKLQLASERQRAIAARGRTEKQWQLLLPEAPTDLPDAAQMQVARRNKWLEQTLPVAPTHLPSLSEPAKKPAAPRRRPGVANPSVGRSSKGAIKKLIADKRQKLDSFVKQRDAMRNELDALMSTNKRTRGNLLPTEKLVLQRKAQALMKMAPAGLKLMAEIHALEQKSRVA